MSNTELTKFYLSLQSLSNPMPEVSYYDIIPALDNHFNRQWTWELADEKIIMDGTMASTTVTVYIPGRVLTGRSLCKIKDYYTNHLFAIMDACQSFITKRETSFHKGAVPSNAPQSTDHNSYQMTPEQINAVVNGHTQATKNEMLQTSVQVDNYKENGVHQDTVPFNKISDNAHEEMAASLIGSSQPQQQPQVNQQMNNMSNMGIAYDAPNPALKGFSQKQIDALNKFKKDYEIINDSMFDNYVNTWDNALTSKSQLTPQNVDKFLAWIETLGNF